MKSLVLTFLLFLSMAAHAAPPLITVKGKAETESAPDYVGVSANIIAIAKTVDRAKSEVDTKARAVFNAIEGFEIADKDLSFGGMSVDREFEYDRNDNEKFVGYSVSRDIEIKIRKFQNYELIVEALIRGGVTSVSSPYAAVNDEAALKTAALKEATAIAKKKAQEIAQGLGVDVGHPYEIGEDRLPSQGEFRQRRSYGREIEEVVVTASRVGNLKDYDPLPFIPDNIKVHATVWVSFTIEQESSE